MTTPKKVAILIENFVEDYEFKVPYNALKQAGMDVVVLGSRMNEKYHGKHNKVSMNPDGTTTEAIASEFDAVVIPGGMAPDIMRRNPMTVRFVREAMQQGKLIAAVCHGPQVLIEADLLTDKQATGFMSIRQDMINAGANYIDEPLVIDGNLITSRQPGDLPIFTTAILSRLGYGGKDAQLPHENDSSAEWWKLADAWGGSTKGDIAKAINTALAGARYSEKALEQYAQKESDGEVRSVLEQMRSSKQSHIQRLEQRLNELGEKPSLTANIADKYAQVKNALKGNDDIYQLRCALGDLQTGIGDTGNLAASLTDPVTTKIFMEIYNDMLMAERRLADLYKARMGAQAKPAKPTTNPAVTM